MKYTTIPIINDSQMPLLHFCIYLKGVAKIQNIPGKVFVELLRFAKRLVLSLQRAKTISMVYFDLPKYHKNLIFIKFMIENSGGPP